MNEVAFFVDIYYYNEFIIDNICVGEYLNSTNLIFGPQWDTSEGRNNVVVTVKYLIWDTLNPKA